MMISVASGKGGTGKTTVSTSLALSIEDPVIMLDCDVEEPNAHIFIKPVITDTEKVYIPVPEIDTGKCVFCGKCQEVCAYNAIAVIKPAEGREGNTMVFPELCHGCGSCSYLCPVGAIKEVPREVGKVERGCGMGIEFVHGKMNIGEAMAPPVIRAVKAKIPQNMTVVIDAPPGTTCPVISSITGSDYCLLVTEPTPFGLNDLKLAVEVLSAMSIPFGVVLNRSDLGDGKTERYCEEQGIPILMKIPFSREIAAAYSEGIPVVEAFPTYKNAFKRMLARIKDEVTV